MTTIWLGKGITASLLQEAEEQTPLETGGILLGWRSPGHICVTNIIASGPAARHEKSSFTPDHAWQSEQVAQAYADSGRRLAYLGDWHTHPNASPSPSLRDLETLRTTAGHPQARCPQPVMIIIGQPHTNQWVASGYLVNRGTHLRKFSISNPPLRTDEALKGFSQRQVPRV